METLGDGPDSLPDTGSLKGDLAAMCATLERAQKRGEITAHRDLDALALTVPAMTTYCLIVSGGHADHRFVTSGINEVLAPAGLA